MFSRSETICSWSSVRTSNSLGTVPSLVMLKVTTPEGKELLDTWQPSSVMVTAMGAPAAAVPEPPEDVLGVQPASARAPASGSTVAPTRSRVERVMPEPFE